MPVAVDSDYISTCYLGLVDLLRFNLLPGAHLGLISAGFDRLLLAVQSRSYQAGVGQEQPLGYHCLIM